MAVDILGMFADLDPQAARAKQAEAFQQRLGQTTDPRAFMAAVGSNLGGQIGSMGTQLFGGETAAAAKNRLKQEALKAAIDSGVDQNDSAKFLKEVQKQLRARGLMAEALALESQVQDIRKNEAYIKQTEAYAKNAGNPTYSNWVQLDPAKNVDAYRAGARYFQTWKKKDGTTGIRFFDSEGKPIMTGTEATDAAALDGETPMSGATPEKPAEKGIVQQGVDKAKEVLGIGGAKPAAPPLSLEQQKALAAEAAQRKAAAAQWNAANQGSSGQMGVQPGPYQMITPPPSGYSMPGYQMGSGGLLTPEGY